MIDYLPWMYMYEFLISSKRPEPIVTYDTLIYPFDNYTWSFILAFTPATFVILAMFQVVWKYASGEPNPSEWLYQGMDGRLQNNEEKFQSSLSNTYHLQTFP